jgi:putative holliday junction resolvase
MESRGRILSIDYGTKTIGLAYSDELGMTVQPLPSIANCGRKDLIAKLKALILELNIYELVLGMPIKLDGTRGDSAIRMEEIMKRIKTGLNIPLIGIDESLSTVEALEFWNNMSPRQQKKYRTVDSLAAAMILERYLKES